MRCEPRQEDFKDILSKKNARCRREVKAMAAHMCIFAYICIKHLVVTKSKQKCVCVCVSADDSGSRGKFLIVFLHSLLAFLRLKHANASLSQNKLYKKPRSVFKQVP